MTTNEAIAQASQASRDDNDAELRAALAALATSKGRTPIDKPTRPAPQLDDYTRMAIESYAGANGLTYLEAVNEWLRSHAIHNHYRSN